MSLRVVLIACMVVASPIARAQATRPDVEKPLPDIRTLVLDIETSDKKQEALRKEYTYHVHSEEEEFDSNDKVKKTTVTDAESFTVGGVRVDREMARNGKPLTPEETKKENERIDKVVAKARERRDKLEGKGKDTDANGDTMISASRILELGTFSNMRREIVDGRPTILLDYVGDPNAKTKNTAEGVMRDLAGTVWVDESDHTLVKAEGHILKDFKIGGGLVADIHAGLHFSMRQQRVNDEVWIPAEIEGEGKARALLFFKVNGRLRLVTSDYRKFRTGSTILPGNHEIGADGLPVPETDAPKDHPSTVAPPKP